VEEAPAAGGGHFFAPPEEPAAPEVEESPTLRAELIVEVEGDFVPNRFGSRFGVPSPPLDRTSSCTIPLSITCSFGGKPLLFAVDDAFDAAFCANGLLASFPGPFF
jgi:hypothetical protein